MSQIEVDKIIPQSGTSTQLGDSGDTITIPAGATITNNGTANGFGSADTEKVKVSANDTTAGFLNGKLVAGTNISLTEGSDGGNETLTAALSGTIATAQIADDAVTLAKMASGTDGNIISYDASGNPVAVATGSAGQVLTSAGAGAPPTFAAISASGVSDGFQAITSGSGTSSASGTLVVNDELFDDGSNYSTSNGRYTAPSNGFYTFHAGALQSASTGSYFYFTKNGSAVGAETRWGYNGAGNQTAMNINMTIDLSTGDYINVFCSQSVYINQYLNFGGCKLY